MVNNYISPLGVFFDRLAAVLSEPVELYDRRLDGLRKPTV